MFALVEMTFEVEPVNHSFVYGLCHHVIVAVNSVNDIWGILKKFCIFCALSYGDWSDRTDWWSMCKSAIQNFEARRVHKLEEKCAVRKSGPLSTSNFQCLSDLPADVSSCIGLLAHSKSHTIALSYKLIFFIVWRNSLRPNKKRCVFGIQSDPSK